MVSPRLKGLKAALLVFLFLWFGGLIFLLNGPQSIFQKYRVDYLPFGFFSSPQGGVFTQDFSYNLVYFRGIEARVVAHPYRLEDQEQLVRKLLPHLYSGISHAYSPIAFILALPLLQVSGAQAYLIYCILSATGILLLFYFHLLPLTNHSLQLYALALCAVSVCIELAFSQGQSALLTTSLLGAFWALLQRREERSSLSGDLWLAFLFWMLCLKPSVAIIPLALLMGARAWRPLAIGLLFLIAAWISVAPLYGGWWTGFQDYFHLLNHYNNVDFSPFMRRDYSVGHDTEIRELFAFDRTAAGVLILILLFLRWSGRLTLSGLFQGLIGLFLLFSPYLLPSEDWILCLLVVEGAFFCSTSPALVCGKLLVLLGIFDLRAEAVVPWQINFELKCFLLAWMLTEALVAQWKKNRVVPAQT